MQLGNFLLHFIINIMLYTYGRSTIPGKVLFASREPVVLKNFVRIRQSRDKNATASTYDIVSDPPKTKIDFFKRVSINSP